MSTDATTATNSFTLSDDYRERLNDVAEPYHDARDSGHDERATELVEELYDAPWGIGGGAGRTVLPIPLTEHTGGEYDEYIVKLATPSHHEGWGGVTQNTREASVWSKPSDHGATTDIREHLVPVIDADPDGYWIIMPRGDQDIDRTNEYATWKSTVAYDLRDIVWDDDINEENTVRLNGDFRLCDYGVGPE